MKELSAAGCGPRPQSGSDSRSAWAEQGRARTMAATGPGADGERIDLSLDDIIKLHRKGPTTSGAQEVGKRPPVAPRPRFLPGSGRSSQQAPQRFRRKFRPQGFSRRFPNAPKTGGAGGFGGRSPLNRPAAAPEQGDSDARPSPQGQPGQQAAFRRWPGPGRFGAAGRIAATGTTAAASAKRPFALKRRAMVAAAVFPQKAGQRRWTPISSRRQAAAAAPTWSRADHLRVQSSGQGGQTIRKSRVEAPIWHICPKGNQTPAQRRVPEIQLPGHGQSDNADAE
ncbi:nucleolar MIF4G domain-containing protein 1-like isoform X3 [Ornithorhynchus anatinus]|uniref:nucleolar MIF4G domain-containing protein 1-like isoform X3 n=1 Tax=Ornithorhynchus anatinus TaxID=9258 RepID=UPI0010A7CCC8|nr:nucleolar MIF4G domain-containing protein 1-like isoform X3 [Ornithorhynchus anatinus]